MAERMTSEAPAEGTVTLVEDEDDATQEEPTLRLQLRKPEPKKKVQWRQGTVDNEHMNKKKSKCCCQYEKPRAFDESSSEDEEDDECDNCHGHVEKKKPASPTEGTSHSVESDPPDNEVAPR